MSEQTPKHPPRLDKAHLGIGGGESLQLSAGGDIDALRRDVQRLLDMEAIRQLKYAYFRCIDTANLEELATLLHEDVHAHFIGGSYEWKLQGRDDYVSNIGAAFHNRAVAQHNGHHPEIEILSEREAKGVWYLADHMWILEHKVLTAGTSLYWDRYEKVDGRWLIRDTRYERIYEINQPMAENPPFSAHYLGGHGQEAPAPAA